MKNSWLLQFYINAPFYLGKYEHDKLCSARYQYNVHEKSFMCTNKLLCGNNLMWAKSISRVYWCVKYSDKCDLESLGEARLDEFSVGCVVWCGVVWCGLGVAGAAWYSVSQVVISRTAHLGLQTEWDTLSSVSTLQLGRSPHKTPEDPHQSRHLPGLGSSNIQIFSLLSCQPAGRESLLWCELSPE